MMQSKSTRSQKPELSTIEHGHQMDGWHCPHPEISPESYIQYSTVQLYCLCVEKFAFLLIIYIKTFNTVNNKTSTTQ